MHVLIITTYQTYIKWLINTLSLDERGKVAEDSPENKYRCSAHPKTLNTPNNYYKLRVPSSVFAYIDIFTASILLGYAIINMYIHA